MTDNEMLEQLEDLITDRKSFLSSDAEANEEFIKDIEALELIISKYENAVLKYKSPDIIYDDYFERVYNLQKLNRNLTETISNNVEVILYQRKVIDKLYKNWDELKKHIADYLEEWQNSDDEWVKGKCDMARNILHDMEEIKEGHND